MAAKEEAGHSFLGALLNQVMLGQHQGLVLFEAAIGLAIVACNSCLSLLVSPASFALVKIVSPSLLG